MAEVLVKAEERLARVCASFSPGNAQDLLNALQTYHEQYYNELLAATSENVVRAQGKLQAISQICRTIQGCRGIVQKIDERRAIQQPTHVSM